jgi:hypothetical protein
MEPVITAILWISESAGLGILLDTELSTLTSWRSSIRIQITVAQFEAVKTFNEASKECVSGSKNVDFDGIHFISLEGMSPNWLPLSCGPKLH